MIPKISLDASLDSSKKQANQTQSMSNHIVINTNSPTHVEASSEDSVKYTPPSFNPHVYDHFIQPPADLHKFEAVEVPGSQLDQLLKENKSFKAENTALQIIQLMMKENPLYVNSLILVDDEKLKLLLKLFTEADDVKIELSDFETSCCGYSSETYRIVRAIYIIKDGVTKNLKYDYPEITRRFTELGINLKVVF
jgi:hypothetical protein